MVMQHVKELAHGGGGSYGGYAGSYVGYHGSYGGYGEGSYRREQVIILCVPPN